MGPDNPKSAHMLLINMNRVEHITTPVQRKERGVDKVPHHFNQFKLSALLIYLENTDALSTGVAFATSTGPYIGVHGLSLPDRRNNGALNAMPGQCLGNKATGFHVFNKLAQTLSGFRPSPLREAHRLLDHHEAARQQPQT